MIRWLLSLFGRRCDFGIAVGRGCLKRARWRAPWFLTDVAFCDDHRPPSAERMATP